MNPALIDSTDPFEVYGKGKQPAKTPAKKQKAMNNPAPSDDPFDIYSSNGVVKKKEQIPSSASSAPSGFQLSSESESIESVPTQKQTPSAFLANDIDESFSFQQNNFGFENLAQAVTPAAPGFEQQQEKDKKKAAILSEPAQLKEYSKNRVGALKEDIKNLQQQLERYKQPNLYLAGSPGAPISAEATYTEGSQPILEEIEAKKKYLEDLKNNVQNVAAYAVVSKEDLSDVSDAKLKSIGAKYLQTINDATVGDDATVLRTMDATGAAKEDTDRTSQNINYRLYKSGANAVARYYGDVAEDSFNKNEGKIKQLQDLFNQQAAEKNPENKAAYQSAINALMEDDGVREYLNADAQAIQYQKKSYDAIDQFPQVKRQVMRQQLSDAYFKMATLKDKATAGSPLPLLNWIFGDQATERDVPALAKETGIPEEQVREIVNSDIKGWFGGADEAGVRIPGALTGIAQSADETLAKAVMGTKRFLGVENVEAKNRILSDRLQDYNLRAQKAKLFDDAGKLNFNPYSVMNTIGTGIGQTAIYAAPSLVTGGIGSGLAASEKIGKLMSVATTTGTGFVGSYEDAYKFAATQTDDEELRRAYALKVGLVNGLSETILEPADIAKKIGFGAKMNADAFGAFAKTYKSQGTGAAVASGLKEFGKVVGTENVEELIALVGETKAKESDLGIATSPGEFINNAIETTITTTLTTLPLGIGAGMNGVRDQSNILKQGLYEAGNEPDLYKSRLKGLLEDGTLNQDQYNDRVAVVNTMAQIVPSIKPTDINGNPLSYEQKSQLAAQQFRILNNDRLLSDPNVIEAEKPLIEADRKDALQKQTDILTGVPAEAPTDAVSSRADENLQADVRNNLVEKIQAIESTNPMVQTMASNPEDAISFIQEQATGMTTARDQADEPAYEGTVNMFGEDIVNQAVSILPQEQKDAIIKSWKSKGIEVTAPLMQAIQSTNTTKEDKKITKKDFDALADEEGFVDMSTSSSKLMSSVEDGAPVEFFMEKKRTGTWDKKRGLIVDEEGLPWGVTAILTDPRGYISPSKNITKNENKSSESSNQKTRQAHQESNSSENAEEGVLNEDQITIGELIDRPVTYKGRRATISQDGQTLIATTEDDGTEFELGNVEEISGADISDFDIEQEQQIANIGDDGSITVRDKPYVNTAADPMNAIVRDEDGNVIGVKLQTPDGSRRTFRGQVAEDLAYQISLREITKDNETGKQFEQFVESDEESRSEIVSGANEEVAEKEPAKDNDKVQEPSEKPTKREKAERKPTEVRKESNPEKPVENSSEKTNKPKKINTIEEAEEELRRMFAMDRMDGGVSGNLPVEEYTKRATAILSQLYPDATVEVYENADEYYEKEGRPFGSLGVFHAATKKLALNLDLIRSSGQSNTILHEVIHPIVNEVLLSDPETFQSKINDAWSRIEELKDVPGMDAVFEHTGKYSTLDANAQKVEGITEFLTQVADGNIDISKAPKALATRIIDLINDLLSLIGSPVRISSESDLDNLASAIKKSFETSDASAISKKIGERKQSASTQSNDAISSNEQERAVRDIISRSKEVDQDQLKNLIKKYTNWSDEKINSLFQKETGITHAQTSETAKEFGFEGYQQSPETFDEWDAEAMEKIKAGYDVGALVNRMSNGHMPTAVEQRIVRFYLQNLEAEVESDPSDINLTKLMAAIRASDIAGGRLVGQALVSRKGTGVRDNSLAGFFVREQEEANGGVPLTDAQKENVKKEYVKIQEAQLKLEQKMIALEKENARLRAQKIVKSEKSKTKAQKKTHTEYVEERKNIISNIKEKLKAARTGESGLTAVPIPYAMELFAIAPDVMKLTRSLIEEGVSNLADIVSDIHGQLKGSMDGLTEKDIHDIIAGDYNEKKPTRSDVTKQLADLRQQAKLQNQLDALLKGEAKKKTPKQKIEWSQQVEDLKAKIKEIQQGDEVPVAKQKLAAIKTRTENAIKQLQGELKTGNYQEEEVKNEVKLDKEAIDLKDKLIKLRQEREIRIMQHQYANRTERQKLADRATEFMNVPRTLMASMDFSAPLRQGIIPTISHPTLAAKAGVEMFRQAVSQKRFDRWFHDLKQSPNYDLMQKSGLYVADPHDPRLSSKEEQFMNNLAEKIPFLGKLVKGSERAYVGYLNKLRVDLFNRFADGYANEGFTFDNSPELYTATASMVNNFTGRGGLGEGKINQMAPVLNSVFFSPRLMASRFNVLGLSDVATFGNGFYSKMPRKVKVQAFKDLAKFIGTGVTLLALTALAFGGDDEDDVEIGTDPRATDFGKIRHKNTRWDIWGGFQPYVRLITQIVRGEKVSNASGKVSELDGKGAFGETRAGVAMRFLRGKLAPVPAAVYNLAEGRNLIGEPVTPLSAAKDALVPLIYNDLKEAIKDRGIGALFTVGLPSIFGVGVQTQNPRGYENVNKDKGVYKTLYDNNLNLSLPPQGEMSDKQYESFVPAQQKIFADQWDEVIKYGAQLNEDGGVTIDANKAVAIKPFDRLTHEEKTSLMQSISKRSTRLAKEELGIEDKKEIKNKEYLNQ